jgi:hypothetical protein
VADIPISENVNEFNYYRNNIPYSKIRITKINAYFLENEGTIQITVKAKLLSIF